MMADDAVSVAKEITVVLMSKITGQIGPVEAGDVAAKVFKAVLKEVAQAIDEYYKGGAST